MTKKGVGQKSRSDDDASNSALEQKERCAVVVRQKPRSSGAATRAVGQKQRLAVVQVAGGSMSARQESKLKQADLVARHVCD